MISKMAIFGKTSILKRFSNWVLSGAMMSCLVYCKYPHTTWRPHWTCLYCRIRRWHYGKLDRNYWRYNRFMRIVLPLKVKHNPDGSLSSCIAVEPDVFWLDENRSYLLFRDPRRKLLALKEVVFNLLAKQCQKMEAKHGKTYSDGFLFLRKNLYTLLEMAAN